MSVAVLHMRHGVAHMEELAALLASPGTGNRGHGGGTLLKVAGSTATEGIKGLLSGAAEL